jgi:hypothetical protein
MLGGFLRKTPNFHRKLSPVAENCDHNIDPWPFDLGEILPLGASFSQNSEIKPKRR